MSDGMGRELVYLSSHATNRNFIPNWGLFYYSPANTPISGYSCLSRSSIGLMSPLLYYFANIV